MTFSVGSTQSLMFGGLPGYGHQDYLGDVMMAARQSVGPARSEEESTSMAKRTGSNLAALTKNECGPQMGVGRGWCKKVGYSSYANYTGPSILLSSQQGGDHE